MADYHPLISRAVAGLENNTGENRRVLYERARAALVNQLRGVDPPLEESDITRERLALEEAIRKVEAEAAKRARPEEEAGVPPAPPSEPRDEGMRGFRDTVAEADNLGGAAAQARRSARDFYEAVPGGDQRPPAADGGPGVHYFEPPRSSRRRRSASRTWPRRRHRCGRGLTKCPRARCRRRRPMTSTRTMCRRCARGAASSSWWCCSW